MEFSGISATDSAVSVPSLEPMDVSKSSSETILSVTETINIDNSSSTALVDTTSDVQLKHESSLMQNKTEELPSSMDYITEKQSNDSERTLRSNSAEIVSSPIPMNVDDASAMLAKESPIYPESPAVTLEAASSLSTKLLQRHMMTPPLGKSDSLNSPTRSLTPMSEKLEGVSPVELIEAPDGSVRIKGDLDHSQLSLVSTPCRSRSSSQSSKSSKSGSPKSHRSPSSKSKKKKPPPPKDDREHDKNDFYCWICHKEGEVLCCELCPRVMHAKCLHLASEPEGDWYCPECEKIMEAECKETQSRAMSQLSIDQLALHLRYALQRMKTSGVEPFLEPVNTKEFPDYLDYVFHPMDLSTLEKNIKKKTYGSTEAFLADVKWILHNCVIYNGPTTKLTQVAKVIVKIAQHEMNEIEVCPECYLNACRKRDNWFCEPCRDPHVLVWAKLQGFPHWPAKALRIEKGQVDVRFFGQHDRAWVPLINCYLMSKEMPLPVKNKKKGRGPGAKGGLDSAMQEAQMYIDNVTRKTGSFEYAPPRTSLTRLDLCHKPTSSQPEATTKPADDKSNSLNREPLDSSSIKKENTDDEEKTKVATDAQKSGSRVLNIKIGSAVSDVSLTPSSAPTKKKSKVVTTSGGHPEKGYRPFAPKKKASMLEKTIASLRDNIADRSEESSSESDSSVDDANDSSSQNSASPDKAKKTESASASETKVKSADDSNNNLAISIKDDDVARKKDSSVNALFEKSLARVKKRSSGDVDKETKPNPKTKSILLNKDADATRKSSPVATSGMVAKRKFTDDSATGVKVRKVEGSGHAKTDRPFTSSFKQSGKANVSVKDKKYNSDGEKTKKFIDPASSKPKKEGTSPHSTTIPKKTIPSDPSVKKKISLSNVAKPKSDDAADKFDLKSTAKMLSKKVMARKLTPGQEKPKNVYSNPSKPPILPPSELAAKKLSSFTIPKHKPSPVRNDSPDPSTVSKYNNHASPASTNQQSRLPSVNVPMQKLKKYNDKMMQNMQHILVEMYEDMLAMFKNSQGGLPATNNADSVTGAGSQQLSKLQLEIEQLKWSHQQQIAELQHNHDLTIAEIRQSLENEKLHVLEAAKRKSDAEKIKAIEETKKKQWCANCGKEAIFYCCWNTSYCDYPCQQLHWPKHMKTCSQAGNKDSSSTNAIASAAETPSKSSIVDIKSPAKTSSLSSKIDEKLPTRVSEKSKPEKTAPVSVPDSEDLNDDEHSDNDMMVIDETDSKPDLISPQSPDPVSNVSLPAKKPPSTAATTEPALTTAKTSAEKSQQVASTSTTTPAALVGSVMSPFTSDKIKALLPRSSSSPSSSANNSTTKVVPSKLIDDIFSKVSKKEVTSPSDTSSKSKDATDSDSVKSLTSASADVATSDHMTTTLADKAASGGSTISAIGERLLEAKRKSHDSGDASTGSSPASSQLTGEPVSSHNTNKLDLSEDAAPSDRISSTSATLSNKLTAESKTSSSLIPPESSVPSIEVSNKSTESSRKPIISNTRTDSVDTSTSQSSPKSARSVPDLSSRGTKPESKEEFNSEFDTELVSTDKTADDSSVAVQSNEASRRSPLNHDVDKTFPPDIEIDRLADQESGIKKTLPVVDPHYQEMDVEKTSETKVESARVFSPQQMIDSSAEMSKTPASFTAAISDDPIITPDIQASDVEMAPLLPENETIAENLMDTEDSSFR